MLEVRIVVMASADQSALICGVIQASSVDASVLGIAPIVLTLAPASAINEQVVSSTNDDQPAAQLVQTAPLDQPQNVAPEPISEETVAPEETVVARAPIVGTTTTEGSGNPGISTSPTEPATKTPQWTPRDSKTRPHECKICGKKLTAKKHLVTHMRRIHEKLKPYECPTCNRFFASNGDLTRHKSTVHVTDRAHKCTICTKAFKTDELMRKHVREVHVDDRLHRCDDCKKAYKTERSLRKHLAIVHGLSTFKFHQCPECGVRVSGQRALQEHQTTVHEKLQPHDCEECGRKFKRKSQVNRHRLCVHSKHKPHKCTVCEKAFAVKSYLTKHMEAVHREGEQEANGEKQPEEEDEKQADGDESMEVGASLVEGEGNGDTPSSSGQSTSPTKRLSTGSHKCEDCDKVLKSKELLRQHQAVVHGKGKFHQCEDCGIRVRGQSALQEHQLAVHGKQKPNQCSDCGKFFTRKRDVKRHQEVVHLKKKPHQCEVCDKMFSKKADLIRHKRVHGDKVSEEDEHPEQGEQQITVPAAVTEEVTRSMESLVDMLVLASEINAGMGVGTSDAGSKEGQSDTQNSVSSHQEEVTLESGIQGTAVNQSSEAAAEKTQANSTDKASTDKPDDEQMETQDSTQDKTDGPATPSSRPITRRLHQCPDCKRTFKTKPSLKEHLGTVHGKGTFYQCPDCELRFSHQPTLDQHQKDVHEKERANKCDECGKVFGSSSYLKRHKMVVHLKVKPYPCISCEMGFSRKADLKRHVDTVHPSADQVAADGASQAQEVQEPEPTESTVDDMETDASPQKEGTTAEETPEQQSEQQVLQGAESDQGGTAGIADEVETGSADTEQMDTSGVETRPTVTGAWANVFVFRPTPDIKTTRRRMTKRIRKKMRRTPVKESVAVQSEKASRVENIALTLAQSQRRSKSEQ